MTLRLVPVTYADACEFISRYHRHHLPPHGWKFGIGVAVAERVVGVITVGRPVARHCDDGLTLEVTRNCTDGTRNACSMLYRAAWRVTANMGYRRLITYTLKTESGSSLLGAGFSLVGVRGGGTWNRNNRPRIDKHPTEQKLLWELNTEGRASD